MVERVIQPQALVKILLRKRHCRGDRIVERTQIVMERDLSRIVCLNLGAGTRMRNLCPSEPEQEHSEENCQLFRQPPANAS